MAILLGIDGTGPMSDSEYRAAFRTSFVHHLLRSNPRNSMYLRGPGWDGLDMSMIIGQGYTFVHLAKLANPSTPVLLTGYSRGAAGVMGVAERLQRDGVTVDGMILFDAVDRAATPIPGEVPANVVACVHAHRSASSFSRWSFDGVARRSNPPTRICREFDRITHGGMGGTPWPRPADATSEVISEGFPEPTPTMVTYAMDQEGSRAVWGWVQPHARRLGFIR